MTTELAPLLEAVDRLAQAMLTGVPVDKRLWTAEACAQYLSYSTAHFLARIACRPDFPKAHHIGTGSLAFMRVTDEFGPWVGLEFLPAPSPGHRRP